MLYYWLHLSDLAEGKSLERSPPTKVSLGSKHVNGKPMPSDWYFDIEKSVSVSRLYTDESPYALIYSVGRDPVPFPESYPKEFQHVVADGNYKQSQHVFRRAGAAQAHA